MVVSEVKVLVAEVEEAALVLATGAVEDMTPQEMVSVL
jgi:hypothetical protein